MNLMNLMNPLNPLNLDRSRHPVTALCQGREETMALRADGAGLRIFLYRVEAP
jgi:hypothetical protein